MPDFSGTKLSELGPYSLTTFAVLQQSYFCGYFGPVRKIKKNSAYNLILTDDYILHSHEYVCSPICLPTELYLFGISSIFLCNWILIDDLSTY